MTMRPQTSTAPATFSGRYQPGSIGRSIVIILVGIGLVIIVTWFVPALTLTSQNVLFRLRGPIEPSRDIVILAIDDRSLQQVGPWPWRREIMADILDRLTPANPRVIGIDIIYSEQLEGPGPNHAGTIRDSDRLLAESIRANGRVVLPAQLYVTGQGQSREVIEWLRPAGMFVDGAAAIGHVHVAPGVDGMVRTVQLSKASDRGERVWAFGLELLRLSENLDYAAIVERQGALQVGSRQIPVSGQPDPDQSDREMIPGVTFLRSDEMQINFAGAAGSFTTLSIADLLNGDLPGEHFRDRIVLIGATAPSMGDSRLAPFTHYGSDLTQGGREMPGVEIHANIINTIRAGLYFRPLSDQVSFLLALLVMVLAAVTVYWLDGWRQLALLGLLLLVMIGGSYFAFDRLLILPPIVPMLTGFAVVLPLLLNRSLAVSRELDDKLATLAASQRGFLPERSTTLPELPARAPGLGLSHSFNWKLKAVESLTDRLLARLSFINRVLASMGDGVVVTDPAGRIVLVNRITGQLLDIPTESLIGQPVVDMLTSLGKIDSARLKRSLATVLSPDNDSGSGESIEVNFSITGPDTRHFSLLFSALVADAEAIGTIPVTQNSAQDPKEVIGVVILISDVTKRVELDRVKTETLQLVSHELRNPLSSIQALSEVLLKFPVTPDKSKEMLTSIHDEAKRLGETLNQYLDLARLESGVRPIRVTMTDPAVLIDQCLRQYAVAADRKQIRLSMVTDPILPRLSIDAGLISIAIGNLIGNAIKYSPQQTEVTVTAESVADRLLISVCDQGPGIPDAARERIFEKFYRLERDNDSETIGSGLGLPLVREILERHGGEVSFQNKTGGGAVFTLSIPLTVHRRHTRS